MSRKHLLRPPMGGGVPFLKASKVPPPKTPLPYSDAVCPLKAAVIDSILDGTYVRKEDPPIQKRKFVRHKVGIKNK